MKITREFLRSLNFRPFEKTDYFGFCGVESPVPLIAEKDNILVIIDGIYAELYITSENGEIDCVDTCDNIRELPFKTEKQIKIENEIAQLEKSIAALKAELN